MRIYIGHSRHSEYWSELYTPIMESSLMSDHDILFPHSKTDVGIDFTTEVQHIDLLLAEVSYPATGLGIELGIAFSQGIPIVCIYKKGMNISGSLQRISDRIIEYSDKEDMIGKIKQQIDTLPL